MVKPPPAPLAKRKKVTALISSDEESEEERPPPRKKAAISPSKPVNGADKPKPRASTGAAKPKPRASTSGKSKPKMDEDFEMASEEGSSVSVSEPDDDEPLPRKGQAKGKPPAKKPRPSAGSSKAPAKVKEEKEEREKPSVNGKGKAKEEPSKKFESVSQSFTFPRFLTFLISWAAAKAAKSAGPVAHGSKEVPDGVPDALAGLSLVFTGELSSFSREEAVDLAKRFGGFVIYFLFFIHLTNVTPLTVAWLASPQVRLTSSCLVTTLVQASWLRSRSTVYEL